MTAESPDRPPASAGDDTVPVSVRLGTVVPPEDPEDWTRPLTWIAAAGMLLAPLIAVVWFWLAAPASTDQALPGTWLLTAAVVVGGVATGVTQIGPGRAFAGTLGAALFASLATVIAGAAAAGTRQVGSLSPTLAHALVAALAGSAGALAAATVAPAQARIRSRVWRGAAPGAIGVAVAVLVVRLLFSR